MTPSTPWAHHPLPSTVWDEMSSPAACQPCPPLAPPEHATLQAEMEMFSAGLRSHTAKHSNGFFSLETAARDGLCLGRAVLPLCLRAPRPPLARAQQQQQHGAGPGAAWPPHALRCLSRELLTRFLSGLRGTASQSHFCSHGTTRGVPSSATAGTRRPSRGSVTLVAALLVQKPLRAIPLLSGLPWGQTAFRLLYALRPLRDGESTLLILFPHSWYQHYIIS